MLAVSLNFSNPGVNKFSVIVNNTEAINLNVSMNCTKKSLVTCFENEMIF